MERRGVGYVRRSIGLAACATAVVAGAAMALDIPGAVVIGIWAGAWFVVPALGWVVGLLPVGLLLLLDPGPRTWAGLAVAAAVAASTVVARRRFVDRPTLRLGVAPYVLLIGIGVGIANFAGTLVMMVLGAMLCAALISTHRPGPPTGWNVDDRHARTLAGITIPTGWRAALLAMGMTAAGVIVWELLDDSEAAIIWLVVGVFVAIAISRPVALLERRTRLNHHAASAVVLAAAGMLLVLITVSGLDDGARATTTLTERLPEVVAQLEDTRFIGPWLEDRNAAVWMDEQMTDLPERLDRVRPEEWLPTVGVAVDRPVLDHPVLHGAADRRPASAARR